MEVMDIAPAPAPFTGRKRKADAQDTHNERLSKRLSLLNLEKNGHKLYVPVENPAVRSATPPPPPPPGYPAAPAPSSALPGPEPIASHGSRPPAAPPAQDAVMQLDDSKYKVYIYNIDDELSSESESDEAKLVFLPDIEKHLRKSRVHILPPVPPSPEGELAGKQLVLYSVPSSLSVPEEHDSVRKAIIEARSRVRARTHAQSAPLSAPAVDLPSGMADYTSTPPALLAGKGGPFPLLSLSGDGCDAMDID